jgi:hypothetical protein
VTRLCVKKHVEPVNSYRSVTDTIKVLLSHLSDEDRENALEEIKKFIRPVPIEKAGDVLAIIAKVIPKRQNWTVDELKFEVKRLGSEFKDKEIYNAIGYLSRRGHLRRVGYGRYVVDGIEIVTAEDLGGETARNEDGYKIP